MLLLCVCVSIIQEPVKMVDQDRIRHKENYRKQSSGEPYRPSSDGFMYRYGKKTDYEVD